MPQKRFHTILSRLIVLVLIFIFVSCAKEKRKDQMTFEELSTKAVACIEKKKGEDAITYLEQIIAQFPDHPQTSKYKMLLAEAYFNEERYPAAHQLYNHFNQFYPADIQAEYAKYKAIMAMFNQTLATDCDQSETNETIKLCQEYLQNNSFKTYRKEITDICNNCENQLMEKEIYIFNFYLHQGKYDAAHNRLQHLRKKYLVDHTALEARLLYLECKLAQKQKNNTLVTQNIKKLQTTYPNSPFIQMAHALASKNTFIF